MRIRIFILLSLLIIAFNISYSQTNSAVIYAKDGQTLNVTISSVHEKGMIDSNGYGIPFFAIDSLITTDSILANNIKVFNPQFLVKIYPHFPQMKRGKNMFEKSNPTIPNNSVATYEKPYLVMLPISLIAFGLAWDYFADASQLNETIEQNKKLGYKTSELETTQTRKTILGITFAIAGIMNTIVAFKSVEVKATPNSLSLSYRF